MMWKILWQEVMEIFLCCMIIKFRCYLFQTGDNHGSCGSRKRQRKGRSVQDAVVRKVPRGIMTSSTFFGITLTPAETFYLIRPSEFPF